jgi:hypothetical protein
MSRNLPCCKYDSRIGRLHLPLHPDVRIQLLCHFFEVLSADHRHVEFATNKGVLMSKIPGGIIDAKQFEELPFARGVPIVSPFSQPFVCRLQPTAF